LLISEDQISRICSLPWERPEIYKVSVRGEETTWGNSVKGKTLLHSITGKSGQVSKYQLLKHCSTLWRELILYLEPSLECIN
jgi:hypothetical protein